jgi:hypothetical protein
VNTTIRIRRAGQRLPGRKETKMKTPEPTPVCPCGDPNCPSPGDCDAMDAMEQDAITAEMAADPPEEIDWTDVPF